MNIPDKHLKVPDNFKFIVEDDEQLGRCVRIYNGKELFWTFTHFTGSKATIVKNEVKTVYERSS